jgi:hypothetical protein
LLNNILTVQQLNNFARGRNWKIIHPAAMSW